MAPYASLARLLHPLRLPVCWWRPALVDPRGPPCTSPQSRHQSRAWPPASCPHPTETAHRAYRADSVLPLRFRHRNRGNAGPFLPPGPARGRLGDREVSSLSAATLSSFPLSAELREGLQRLGIQNLAEVQRLCILQALGGKSLAVAATAGAGKTLAYLLPVLQRFITEAGANALDISDVAQRCPFAMLLVPSRELARQVASVAMALLPQAPVLLLDPTAPLRHHQQLLQHLPGKVLIATPDRILALLRQKRLTKPAAAEAAGPAEPALLCLSKLRVLVVDEADALLRRDYRSKLSAIYRAAVGGKERKGEKSGAAPDCRHQMRDSLQVLFFSAVLPQELLSTIEEDFPHVRILDLVNAPHHLPQRRMIAEFADAERCREVQAKPSHSGLLRNHRFLVHASGRYPKLRDIWYSKRVFQASLPYS